MRVCLVIIWLMILGCDQSEIPDSDIVLSDSVMINLVTDVFIMQAALDDTPVTLRDSVAIIYQNDIANLYGHTWEDLYTYISENAKDLERMDEIYSSVLNKIKAIEDESD